MLHKGGTALEAAANIHTDLARGFIRAETMRCDDLIRLGSEREIKAHNLMRSEPKDYVVQDGDILHIRFSVWNRPILPTWAGSESRLTARRLTVVVGGAPLGLPQRRTATDHGAFEPTAVRIAQISGCPIAV